MSIKVSKKVVGLALVSVMMVGALAACGKSNNSAASSSPSASAAATATASAAASATPAAADKIEGTVTASGSTALLPLVKQAADDFMAKNKNVTTNVTGGGSGTGVKNVSDGTSTIGNSDVPADDKSLVEHIVAVAPFALIANNDVTIDNLTKQQAADILSGKITNWKQVGGQDEKITVITRPASSGSRKLVKSIVLGDADITKDALEQAESGALKTAVAGTKGAIGYVDAPYLDGTIKALKFDGVAFSEDTIKNGTYPLYGQERMYTKGEATGAAKAFIDFILSNDFQNNQVKQLKFLSANLLKK